VNKPNLITKQNKMKSNIVKTCFHALALAAFAGASASAADVVPQARDILNHNQGSIINVTAMAKLDMSGSGLPISLGGFGDAQETQCAGTVIDASGLTVVAYSALNPLDKVVGAFKFRMGDDDSTAKTKTELNHIRMRLADGSEVSARVVLKDKELDLAFLLPDPKEGEKTPPFAPAKLSTATARELDDVVILSRHPKELGYQPVVTVSQVSAVIKQPRAMYDLATLTQPGSPVFLPDGQLLGLCVTFGGEDGNLMSLRGMQILVLPAAEISKLADQAKKAAEKKAAEPAKSN
jgi:S1-C subfamily serine protease